MTGTLALVGGAAWTEGCSFDAELLRVSGGDRVVVIPTAAAYEQPRAVVETATAWFGQLGASVEAVWALRRSDALAPGVADPVRDARFVYISGGSPMHLRSVLKDTPLWDAIVDCWHRDRGHPAIRSVVGRQAASHGAAGAASRDGGRHRRTHGAHLGGRFLANRGGGNGWGVRRRAPSRTRRDAVAGVTSTPLGASRDPSLLRTR